jgi:RNA 3'-terminal phosphate cyclase (ATP)
VSNLSPEIAKREVRAALDALNWGADAGEIGSVPGLGPGNIVVIDVTAEHAHEVCTAFGEIGVRAEAVAARAADEARRYLAAGVPVGEYLADQLLPILALGEGGVFRTVKVSQHTRTNADIIREFVNVDCTMNSESRDVVRVELAHVG